jgi:MoaD family protein
MNIQIKYFAQVKKEAGKGSETLEMEAGINLQSCVEKLSTRHTKSFREMLYDESGAYRDSVILIINNDQVRYAENPELNEGDELMIMSPIAGG